MTNQTEITDPVEAEVVKLIRSAQGNVTQAVQLLVGSLRLYKQLLLRYQELEKAAIAEDKTAALAALTALQTFRDEIAARANQSSANNSPADSPGA